MTLRSLAVAVASLLYVNSIQAAEDNQDHIELREVTIIGSAEDAQQITGSAYIIDESTLQEFAYSDIQRLIREVPGVSIQLEDGYGLRPNISIRGVATERSGRITLLEDNVLIAPAPYSAPSAYYFPTMGRMSGVEVLKGPSAISQGPYTIGGALNMISTPIPNEFGGRVLTEVGQDSTYRVHAQYGGRTDQGFGFLLETHQWQSDGFQTIDRSNRDTGLDIEDYTVKLSYAPQGSAHRVELKLQQADQISNQSYLGLTDFDFTQSPFRRYGLSALDHIETEHEQQILRYEYTVNEQLALTATAYNNEHARDWFKTEGIDFDGSTSAEDFNRTSWFNVVQAINSGSSLAGLSAVDLQGILDGTIDTATGGVQLRSNAREYFSRGIQLGGVWELDSGRAFHEIEFGIRFHEDEEDRLQRNSTYTQIAGELSLADLGELGNAGNRVQEAQAVALHVYDTITMGNWTLTPGLRYEDIDQKRTRYNDGALRTYRDSRENETQVWLPGLGARYQIDDRLALVGGVHKGFTAPSNSPGVKEEEALNYELGFRFNNGLLDAEVMGFYSDYENLLGECTSSSGTDCVIGDAFNGDAATVKGVEVLLGASLLATSSLNIPLTFSFTHIDGEFDTDIADTAFFGDVSAGDPIPYIPENQFRLSLGLEARLWSVQLSGSYIDEVCVRAACSEFEKADDSFTVDLAANYQLSGSLDLYARIENLSGEEAIMGRHPYGARPNKDTTASVGLRLDF